MPDLLRGPIGPADCQACPFAKNGQPSNPVRGIGPSNPLFVVVGEAPTLHETRIDALLVGPAGELVQRACRDTGVRFEAVWRATAIACVPTAKADEKTKHIAATCCSQRLAAELAAFPGRPVLTLGGIAAKAVLGDAMDLPITQIASTHFEVDGRDIIPTTHPSAILRSQGDDATKEKTGGHTVDLGFWALQFDILKVAALARGEDIRMRMRPGVEIFTELDDSERARNLVWERLCEARSTGMLAIDLETTVADDLRNFALQAFVAQIKLLGLASGDIACSVRWDLLDSVMVDEFVAVLADASIAKVFHNATYDVAVLENQWYGFKVNGSIEDTMLAQHASWPGAPKGLQRVASQFRAVPSWKSEYRSKGDSLEDEAVYCLHESQSIEFADGSLHRIDRVVLDELTGPVKTVLDDGTLGSAEITGWHRNRVKNQEWIEIRTEISKPHVSGLTVTPDHRVMTTMGWKQAKDVTVGDELYISEPRLDATTLSALAGTLLGDSTLAVSPTYRANWLRAPFAYLNGGHNTESRLAHRKSEAIPLLILRDDRARVGSFPNGTFSCGRFTQMRTRQLRQLRELLPELYDGRSRIITLRLLDMLGPVGWAWWFMDDGCLQKQKYGLNTLCLALTRYSAEHRHLVIAWLRNKFGNKINSYRDGVVRFGKQESRGFCRFISPFVFMEARYKLEGVLGELLPPEVIWRADLSRPLAVRITEASSKGSLRRHRDDTFKNDTRWCITVDGPGKFFTPDGLVSNCAADTRATSETLPVLDFWVKKSNTQAVYNVDRVKSAFARQMHLKGCFIDPDVNRETGTRLQTVIDDMNAGLLEKYESLKDRVHHRLCSEKAKSQRKADPSDYGERIAIRVRELEKDIAKGKFKFDMGNDWHAIALLKSCGVSLWQTTPSGRTATGAAILEKLAEKHPEVEALVRLRSNEQLLSTFIKRMFQWTQDSQKKWKPPFVQDTGRIHPLWSPTQISGRFSSEKPACSNWSEGDETNKDPRNRLPNIRRQLVAPPGRAIVGFDYEQLEARLMALQSGDPFLCDVFRSGKDIHREFGIIIFPQMAHMDKKDPEYIRLRNLTKRFEYGALYGGADATVHRAVATDEPSMVGQKGFNMVRAAIVKMKQCVGGVLAWQQRVFNDTCRPPFTIRSFVNGRCRIFPLGSPPPTECSNFPNQSTAGDIIDNGLARFMPLLAGFNDAHGLIHQHDAIYVECDEDQALNVAKAMNDAFPVTLRAADGLDLDFPIEVKIGFSYASEPSDDMKQRFPHLVWDVGRPGLTKVRV